MTVIVCIDSGRGIAFCGRRRCTDRGLAKRISEKFGDAYFDELSDPAPMIGRAERLVIYRWNRKYPADVYLTADPYDEGFRLSGISDFKGTSHDRITEEVWVRKTKE
ncbi:MAG: hypothetical protein IKN38_00865 [Clostridia bacterium]|nr:hypothetical protein [Clostridia bacterium]